ncbi:MAG TPA: RNA polymerase sigma factor [Kiritimatiellia bacterium]|nr:RNA polymerase sigma factor [Kiritimatiellia bacterium]
MSSDEENVEEWEWLARAAAGDDTAFRAIVERYQGRLLNFFLRAGAKDHAEDLVQETFIRLHRHRSRARPLARFTTYAHTLAHHVWIDHVRRQSRRLRLLERAAPEMDQADGRSAGHAPARIDAERLLATLTPDLRGAVVLVIYQGLAYAEAAEVLGVPTGTVKSRVFNALHRMRTALEPPPHGGRHET